MLCPFIDRQQARTKALQDKNTTTGTTIVAHRRWARCQIIPAADQFVEAGGEGATPSRCRGTCATNSRSTPTGTGRWRTLPAPASTAAGQAGEGGEVSAIDEDSGRSRAQGDVL